MTPDLAALVQQYNVDTDVPGASHLVSVADLRAALDKLPDRAYLVLHRSDDDNTPVAREEDGSVSLAVCWYDTGDCTWAGDVNAVGPDADGDLYEPTAGRDVLAFEVEGINY